MDQKKQFFKNKDATRGVTFKENVDIRDNERNTTTNAPVKTIVGRGNVIGQGGGRGNIIGYEGTGN